MEEEMLLKLRHEWKVVSIDPHAKGYWDMEEDTFDLRVLKQKENLGIDEIGEIYLASGDEGPLIKIKGDGSYYLINEVDEKELSLTCYFKGRDVDQNNIEPIKLATFRLSKAV